MDKQFLVCVNLSNCSSFTAADKIFATLVDPTQMTLVYEFKVWLKWMFSLDICVQIKHQNYVIHDMEDIKILAFLKKIDLCPCPERCFHSEQANMALLQQFNHFLTWENVRVPKSFTPHLQNMSVKLQANCAQREKTIVGVQTSEISKPKPRLITHTNSAKDEPSNSSAVGADAVFPDPHTVENTPQPYDPISPISQPEITSKPKRLIIKPFSLGEVLRRCRSSYEEEAGRDDSVNASVNKESDAALSVDMGCLMPIKKRKRVRKHKSKSRSAPIVGISNPEDQGSDGEKQPLEKKQTIFGFSGSEADDELVKREIADEENSSAAVLTVSMRSCADERQDVETYEDQLMENSQQDLGTEAQPSVDSLVHQYDNAMPKENNELHELMTLKHKFSTPLVFHRKTIQ